MCNTKASLVMRQPPGKDILPKSLSYIGHVVVSPCKNVVAIGQVKVLSY